MSPKYKWGIRKKGRLTDRSYTGPTWSRIGVINPPTHFETKREADQWVELLNEVNRVGFESFAIGRD